MQSQRPIDLDSLYSWVLWGGTFACLKVPLKCTFYGHFIFCSMKIQSMVFQGKRVLLCVVAREHNPSDLITSYILDSH